MCSDLLAVVCSRLDRHIQVPVSEIGDVPMRGAVPSTAANVRQNHNIEYIHSTTVVPLGTSY
eukprot:COSAG02_NODE_1222_length_13800_cov_66.755565_9_plen_62_part_00